jgi:hypothetical protein
MNRKQENVPLFQLVIAVFGLALGRVFVELVPSATLKNCHTAL